MGRGRTKGKKLSAGNQYDPNSCEEEKSHVQRKRGRPQKSPKDETDETVEARKQGDDEDRKDASSVSEHNGKKRKINGQVKEKDDYLAKENNGDGNGRELGNEVSAKSNGFRQSRNRRKNKPRRAAEAVVECN